MARNVLIIDDDTQLTEVLVEYLERFDLRVRAEATPRAGLKALQQGGIDLVILDVMLPDKSGIEVCREIRQTSDVPVIMLTARGDVPDRIVGLEVGADDYLPKPFEPRELVARVTAILRRPRFIDRRRVLKFKDLEVNLKDRTATAFGELLELTTMEFEVLALLAAKPGEVFSRDQIMDQLRGVEYDSFSRTIDVLLSRLRAKLRDDPKHPRFIKTIWGSGYTFLGKEEEVA